MLHKCCEHLQHGLFFSTDSIWNCRYLNGKGFDSEKLINNFKDSENNAKEYAERIIDLKKQKINEFKKGNIPECCRTCPHCIEKNWNENISINQITFSHWTKCNASCIYCYISKDKEYFNSFEENKVLPILEALKNHGVIDFGGNICFSGGDITELEEFDKLTDFFIKNKQQKIYVQSSGIKYSKEIEKLMSICDLELNISIDSGDKDTYKLIKKTDKYNEIKENITKYQKNKRKNSYISSKFLIIPNYNDRQPDIDKWIKECINLEIDNLAIDLETEFLDNCRKQVPDKIPTLINYIKEECNKQQITLQLYGNIQMLLDNLQSGLFTVKKEDLSIEKEYYSCEDFLHSLSFMPEGLRHCMYMPPQIAPPVIPIIDGNLLNPDDIFEYKQEIEKQRIQGEINENCKNCFKSCQKNHDNQKYISSILISHRTDCNAECIFCYNQLESRKYNPYKILPQLEQFKPYFKNGCEMHFGGGEPTVWDEFNDIIDFALRENFSKIIISSNGSIFSQKLADAIEKGIVNLVITTDTADSNAFRKMKKIDFETVKQNIKKYLEYDKSGNAIQNKLIILPCVNDSEEEINQWINFNKELGIKNLAIDVEAIYFNSNRKNISPAIKKIVKYAEKTISDNGFNCSLYSFAQQMKHDSRT